MLLLFLIITNEATLDLDMLIRHEWNNEVDGLYLWVPAGYSLVLGHAAVIARGCMLQGTTSDPNCHLLASFLLS